MSYALIRDRVALLQQQLELIAALVAPPAETPAVAIAEALPPEPVVAEALPPEPLVAEALPPEPKATKPKVAKAKAAPPKPTKTKKPTKRAKAASRWSYVDTAAYRLLGDNPFRRGNQGTLFAYLADTYGDAPFTRVQLGEAIANAPGFESVQPEAQVVISFVTAAGKKGALEMATMPEPVHGKPKVVRRTKATKKRS